MALLLGTLQVRFSLPVQLQCGAPSLAQNPAPERGPSLVVLRGGGGRENGGNPISRTAAALAQDWHTALGPCTESLQNLISYIG